VPFALIIRTSIVLAIDGTENASNKSLHSTIYALSLVCMVAELPF